MYIFLEDDLGVGALLRVVILERVGFNDSVKEGRGTKTVPMRKGSRR